MCCLATQTDLQIKNRLFGKAWQLFPPEPGRYPAGPSHPIVLPGHTDKPPKKKEKNMIKTYYAQDAAALGVASLMKRSSGCEYPTPDLTAPTQSSPLPSSIDRRCCEANLMFADYRPMSPLRASVGCADKSGAPCPPIPYSDWWYAGGDAPSVSGPEGALRPRAHHMRTQRLLVPRSPGESTCQCPPHACRDVDQRRGPGVPHGGSADLPCYPVAPPPPPLASVHTKPHQLSSYLFRPVGA